jgi:hypothetical protein
LLSAGACVGGRVAAAGAVAVATRRFLNAVPGPTESATSRERDEQNHRDDEESLP